MNSRTTPVVDDPRTGNSVSETAGAARHVLIIAFHFPPLAGSSGIQRTLRFVQHLPEHGWSPVVLTADPRAYERTNADLLRDVPATVPVTRAFALDTARHLTIARRYLGWMARPDRWTSWRFDAVRQGLQLIRRYRPAAIWSTYPIATAHEIGAALQRRSGLPWIADFRDPMAQDGYPTDPRTWEAYARIETTAARQAACCVFTTPGALRTYRERFPAAAGKMALIENGYDEASFAGLTPTPPDPAGPLVLLHSGIVYPSERDPTQLIRALALLRDAGAATPRTLRVRFRAAVHDDLLRRLAAEQGVEAFVEVEPAVGYRAALAEMTGVGCLLVLQASNCNEQVPAKLYEYLRAGRPIAALTDPAGDTAGVLRDAGVPYLAPLDNAEAIAALLSRILDEHRAGTPALPEASAVAAASRRERARALAGLLDQHAARKAA